MDKNNTIVLTNEDVFNRLRRMSWEVLEKHHGAKTLLLAGIADRGHQLAERLQELLEKQSKIKITCIKLDLDKESPYGKPIDIEGYENFKDIVVIDDVLNSGKTLIYAVNAFLAKPVERISTLVLVDRNHNRYPIKADIIGLSLATTLQEHVSVELGKKDVVYLS